MQSMARSNMRSPLLRDGERGWDQTKRKGPARTSSNAGVVPSLGDSADWTQVASASVDPINRRHEIKQISWPPRQLTLRKPNAQRLSERPLICSRAALALPPLVVPPNEIDGVEPPALLTANRLRPAARRHPTSGRFRSLPIRPASGAVRPGRFAANAAKPDDGRCRSTNRRAFRGWSRTPAPERTAARNVCLHDVGHRPAASVGAQQPRAAYRQTSAL